ncbi:hypothetical protein GCM10023195_62150 [Actinoallomurus liliacearum]|uniref:Uncharacterized protein n=1 Tax=Actinoallomurus liliacearum TaxID=1080073 RepID=A0ABP8TR42_9ACTN
MPTPTFRSIPYEIRRTALFLLFVALGGALLVAVSLAHPWTGDAAPSANPGGAFPEDSGTSVASGVPQFTPPPDSPSSPSSTDGASSAGPDDGRSQATALQTLLDQGAPDRKAVVAAVQDVQSCGTGAGLDADISALTQAAANRSNLADQAGRAQVDALENGSQAAQDLATAFQKSALADRAFAAWATDLKSGRCTAGSATRNQHYKDAESASEEAGKAKDGFVAAWSSIAGEYGLQPVTTDDF